MKIKACLQNNSDDWKTPERLYKFFVEQNKCVDVAPYKNNLTKYNGLEDDWTKYESVFINPPYSQIKKWVEKAIKEHGKGNNKKIIMLLPCITDTKWFRALYNANATFHLITERLKFSDSKAAPFPSVIVRLDRNHLCIFEYTYYDTFKTCVKEETK